MSIEFPWLVFGLFVGVSALQSWANGFCYFDIIKPFPHSFSLSVAQ